MGRDRYRNWAIVLGITTFLLLGLSISAVLRLAGANRLLDQTRGRFKKTEQKLEEQRTFLVFEDKLPAIIKPVDQKNQEFLENSPEDPAAFTRSLEELEEDYEQVAREYDELEIPGVLPDKVKTPLKQAKKQYSEASSIKATLLESAVEFSQMEDDAPGLDKIAKDVESNLNESRELLAKAKENLKEVRLELNLPSTTAADMSGRSSSRR